MIKEIDKRKDGKRVITVIFPNPQKTSEKQSLHCLNCGRIVLDHYTKGDMIVVLGEMTKLVRPTDHLCSRCKVITRMA